MSPIHDRMPAIHLLRPFPETTLQIHAANPGVGNVHNQDAALLDPQ
jgi:putative SOS response-associated peptidase YedK